MPVDAVILPNSFKVGASSRERMHRVLDIAEPLLGGKGYGRNQGEFAFITKDPNDAIYFKVGHPLEKQHRYDWTVHPDGIRTGMLKDDPYPEEASNGSNLPGGPAAAGGSRAIAPGVVLSPPNSVKVDPRQDA